ncbi:hypothetical protein NLJ89_g4367 [Agrocybe chaxingu]|uniref:Nucleoporin nup45 n=1 Tax=Agrocybe chaxingu TaxID=84603 RepID=A0A9W8K8U7_9AGAR|nr:hypothetical protein NLJ89_g4367 [Agrocybe chaxingu]
MAFATSTSAFGMKPATGTTSLFGQPQQQPANSLANAPPLGQTQPQGTGLFGGFGQSQQQNQQQTGGSLFGQPRQQQTGTGGFFGQPQQQTTTGGLFGQTQPQQTTGGLFGQPQQQQPAGGLFGQPQQQQQPAGGLFGQTQQQQQPAGGLFGQPQQQQQPAAGGLFGQPQQQQQQPQGGLFGSTLFGTNTNANATTQQPQQGGLFGSTTGTNPLQAQATLPAGAFGSSTTGGAGGFGGLGGGSTLFGTRSQQPQQQPQSKICSLFGNMTQNTGFGLGQSTNLNASTQPAGPPPFTKSTKFNDLPDDIKKVLETIDTHIQGRVQICKDLQQRKLGDEPTKGHDAIRSLHKDLVNTATTIRNDSHITQDLKAKVDQAVEDTIVATRIIDGFRNPQSGSTYLKDHAAFPLEYFTRVTDQMKERLAWYKTTIEQIERKLASATNSMQTPQSISATLQAQHSTFLALASKTAAVDAELQKIKALYTQLWRAKTGSVRDPFNDVVKPTEKAGDFGLSGLNVR